MTVLALIDQLWPSLTTAERQISGYIRQQGDGMGHLSSAVLAKQSGVSQSTIVKFAQKLGFDGYTSLRLAISQDVARRQMIHLGAVDGVLHNTIHQDDDWSMIAAKLMQEKIHALQETTRIVDYDILDRMVSVLNKAHRVHLVGVGASFDVCRDFGYKLIKIGMGVLLAEDTHVQLSIANTLTSKDVLMVISHSGQRNVVLSTASVAHRRDVPVLALTGPAESALRKMASLCLTTLAEEGHMRSSAISSRTAQHVLTDLLFLALLRENPERQAQLEATRQLFQQLA